MSDLSLAQMLALLADNTAAEISATDVQDVVTALFERTDGTNALDGLLFDTAAAAPAHTPGHVRWNATADTLELDVSTTDVTLQIGQEMWIVGRNTTGSTITNGTPVKITGASGNRPLIAADDGLGGIVGIATHDIANNSNGKVTEIGLVRDLDTSSFSEGDVLYATSAGALSTAVSSSRVGRVTTSHASQGVVLANPLVSVAATGTTAQRPTTVAVGFMYFDTTLGYAIWWDGSNWVDATGSTV